MTTCQNEDSRLQIKNLAPSPAASWRNILSVRSAVFPLIVFLAAPPAARASDFSDDLAARRARVMDRLGPEGMLILWSAPIARYSNDVDYEYRQDSNLYYL